MGRERGRERKRDTIDRKGIVLGGPFSWAAKNAWYHLETQHTDKDMEKNLRSKEKFSCKDSPTGGGKRGMADG